MKQAERLPDGTYKLKTPVTLPSVLDVLIVGGGPAGTAAAFRAKELGLSALVIDYDDLMKRIRDYAKDKLILPNFGGGDRMRFPAGGDLVAQLVFPDIDKDDMCVQWKALYYEHSVPARLGVELTGLDRVGDVWAVRSWNHNLREEEIFRARHVVIAIGRGVPRRFDIPGNTDGIAYRLDDSANYIEGPVCVIGGGTSSAEAVIAISDAKITEGDPSPVYWSYRGTKMPRVSKALSDVFFNAYVGNGNIRYYPQSEPAAVITGPDREEYLSVRVDRKALDGRPSETLHLEFSKTRCIACIGEDIPEAFLKSLGINMVKGGPHDRKLMVVTPWLETRQPNVYLIGDLLSPAYLSTEDFGADPAGFEQVSRNGNVKAALRDGVLAMNVIRQKLDGQTVIRTELEDLPEDAASDMPTASLPSAKVETEGPPEASFDTERRLPQGVLVETTLSGVDAEVYKLKQNGVTTIGRDACDISFPKDEMMAENHASIIHRDEHYYVRDEGSRSGTFIQLKPGPKVTLEHGDLLRIGRQFLLLQGGDSRNRLHHYDHRGQHQGYHELTEQPQVFGRPGGGKTPDVVLDDKDMSLSRFHLQAGIEEGHVKVVDYNSLNGTYLQVKKEIRLSPGDVLTIGSQMLRLDVAAPKRETGAEYHLTLPERPSMMEEPEPAPLVAEPTTAQVVVGDQEFEIDPEAVGADDGSVMQVLGNQGVIQWQCSMGMCGMDPVRIISGHEHVNEVDDTYERGCLERLGLEPGTCRMACKLQVGGPVTLEVV